MKKMCIVGIVMMLVLSGVAFLPLNSMAATDEEIQTSIDDGIAWLVAQQNSVTGAWQDVPRTGFVLIKLQDRAYELDYESPFDPGYPYSDNVIAGWQYLLTAGAWQQAISVQPAGDPDSNGNGYGISFSNSGYYTGICLMALAATGTPNRPNDGGLDYDGDSDADTYGEMAQEVVDWLSYGQVDAPSTRRGAWGYGPNSGGDNSVSGYAVLGLAAAEGFGCTILQFVKDELSLWIDEAQNDPGVADDYDSTMDPDGGSGYIGYYAPYGSNYWVNMLKTGNLLFEMTFVGDGPGDQRFDDALDYIERHWHDENYHPGWGYNQITPAHYQAMYCLMKGLEYSGIDMLDLDGDDIPEHDWYAEFADVIISQQHTDGYWVSSPCYVWYYSPYPWGTMSYEILSTVWNLLNLEKVTPPPPFKTVELIAGKTIDIGEIHIWIADGSLFVKFITEGDWYLTLMHVHVAMDPGLIPQTKKGNPIPGLFEFHGICDSPEQEFLFEIPWQGGWDPDGLCIAAHAEVVTLASDCVDIVSDTTTTFDGVTSGASGDAVLAWVHPNWNSQPDIINSFSAAQWIWESYQVVHEVAGDVVDFFKTVFIPGLYPLDIDGELNVTCDNGYELYLNDMGNYLGRYQLEDGWRASDLTESYVHSSGWQTVEYFDISDYLVCGDNFFKFATANEYMGPDDGQGYGTKTSNPAGLIFEGNVCYTVVTQEETAWGEGEEFPGSSWGMYILDP